MLGREQVGNGCLAGKSAVAPPPHRQLKLRDWLRLLAFPAQSHGGAQGPYLWPHLSSEYPVAGGGGKAGGSCCKERSGRELRGGAGGGAGAANCVPWGPLERAGRDLSLWILKDGFSGYNILGLQLFIFFQGLKYIMPTSHL